MRDLKIKFKKVRDNAIMPKRAYKYDAGADLTVSEYTFIEDKIQYKFGIAVEIPKGYAGFIFPRSSVHKMDLRLSNSVGVIDHGFTNEISAIFDLKALDDIYDVGERAAQLVIIAVELPEFVETKELEVSDRGLNGYGSTGN
jgi:dUTP pyrophosphatase